MSTVSLYLLAIFLPSLLVLSPALHAQRVTLATPAPGAANPSAQDAGVVPSSQSLHLILRLGLSADRSAALDQLLSDQITPASASYHQWLTPPQFAAQFGATDDQLAQTTTWLQSQGLTIESVSPAKTRIALSGTAAQIQSAFEVTLRRYQLGGTTYFSNSTEPSVPSDLAPLIAGISGLDNMPPAAPATLATFTSAGPLALPAATAQISNPLIAASQLINLNAASILTFDTAACSADFVQSDYDAYHDLFRQANAQGITVLTTSACGVRGTGSFPASLGEVTALSIAPTTQAFVSIAGRPAWQNAPGLPEDASRHEPDLTSSSLGDFAQTLVTIFQRAGVRQGNINPVLYALAPTPSLFTQPDTSVAGTWESPTGLGLVDLTLLAKNFPVGTSSSATSIATSSSTLTHGQNVTVTATVTASGSSVVPGGTVTFSSTQSGVLGTAILSSTGVASLTTNQLAGGVSGITATYNGDATYARSTSSAATVTVQGEAAQIAATVVPGATAGGNVTINVTVSSVSGVGIPTGPVTVTQQGAAANAVSTAPLARSGAHTAAATVSFPATQAGILNLMASCSGDSSFTCNTPIAVQANVGKAVSATALVLARTSSRTRSAMTLTATVPSVASISATGAVTFMDGTTVLSSSPIASGNAVYSGVLAPGQHSFTAHYAGDTNLSGSTSPTVNAVNGTVATTTSLSSTVYTVSYGQAFTLTSTVTPSSSVNGAVPTGSISFISSTQGAVGSAQLNNGTATLTLGMLNVGTYTLTANYSGDENYAASASTSSVVITVAIVNATLTATISPASNVPYGATATATATVSLPNSSASPSGTVSAVIESVAGATSSAILSPNPGGNSATANVIVSAPPPGTYTVQITCTGNQNFQCQTPVNIVPFTTVKGNTLTSLTVDPVTPQAGTPVKLTAVISNAGNGTGLYNFTGSVAFYDNGKLLTSTSVGTNLAMATVTLTGNVTHNIVAAYSGDANWTASQSAGQMVNPTLVPSTITLTSSVSSSSVTLAGVNVIFTTTVSSALTNLPNPTGTVTLYDTFNGATITLGSPVLAPNGPGQSTAVFSSTGLQAGVHHVYAVYAGDPYFAADTSSPLSVSLADFNLTMNPLTLSVSRGSSAKVGILVGSTGSFLGTVTFGCSPSAGSALTCSFSPSSVTAGGSTTMTIATTAPATTSAQKRPPQNRWSLVTGVSFAMLFCFILPRRRALPTLFLLLCGLCLSSNIGCGSGTTAVVPPSDGGSSSGGSNGGSPLGTQILTITAAGSDGVNTIRHNYQYQVTIQ